MTLDDIHAAWLRFMHRRDIEADLATIDELAAERIATRIMVDDLAPTPEQSPRLWLHAGLASLHELAQDDESLQREAALFEAAAVDYHFRWSQDNVIPTMLPEMVLVEEAVIVEFVESPARDRVVRRIR